MEGKLTGRKAIRLVQTEPVRTADPSTELAPDLPKQTETRYKKYWNEWIALGLVLPVVAAIAADQALERLSPQTLHLSHRWRIAMRIAIWAVLLVVALYWIVRGKHRTFQHWRGFACSWLVIGLVPLTAVLWRHIHRTGVDTIFNTRNFYGVLSVYDYRRDEPKSRYRLLQHGRITHGLQFVDPEQATWPTTYYGEGSGVSLAINALTNPGRHVGLVGLGTGTLSAYARPGDHFRIYEINPQVRQIATNYFSYVTHAKGDVQIVLGDARLSLERERPQQFDLLALDAFSSDSIPVHLLTRQAFELYGRHLKTNGIIAVHISNHYLDLQPVVLNLAREFKYKFAIIDYEESDDDWWLYGSTWILLSRDEELLRQPSIAYATSPPDSKKTDVPTWTDDFTSLYQILK